MENMPIPIEFTGIALEQIQSILQNPEIPEGMTLKCIAALQGCSDKEFQIAIDFPGEEDQIFEFSNISIAIPKHQIMHFFGVTLDYQKLGKTEGFVFKKQLN